MAESYDNPPQFSDGPAMPEMCEAMLGDDDVANLFDDLAACTTILAVNEKGGELSHAGQGPSDPALARERLLSRSVRGLQIRYAWQGHEWTDTLMCLPDGIRLIRCQHSERPSTLQTPH